MGQAGGLLRTVPAYKWRGSGGEQRAHLAEAYCSVLPTPSPLPALLRRWSVPPPSNPPPISTCMAAIPQWKRAIGFSKRLSDHISGGGPAPPRCPPAVSAAPAAARRGVHASVYDKNPEEHVRPALVPDDVIQPHSAGKYWGPHPSTGVFSPADTDGRRPDVSTSSAAASPGNGGSCGTTTSVLDQKVWFRPLEGVDTHLA